LSGGGELDDWADARYTISPPPPPLSLGARDPWRRQRPCRSCDGGSASWRSFSVVARRFGCLPCWQRNGCLFVEAAMIPLQGVAGQRGGFSGGVRFNPPLCGCGSSLHGGGCSMSLQETAKFTRVQITYDGPLVSYLTYDGPNSALVDYSNLRRPRLDLRRLF
jgi:hypothetical protein